MLKRYSDISLAVRSFLGTVLFLTGHVETKHFLQAPSGRTHEALARLEEALLGGQGDLHTRLNAAVREARRVIDGILAAFPPETEPETDGNGPEPAQAGRTAQAWNSAPLLKPTPTAPLCR